MVSVHTRICFTKKMSTIRTLNVDEFSLHHNAEISLQFGQIKTFPCHHSNLVKNQKRKRHIVVDTSSQNKAFGSRFTTLRRTQGTLVRTRNQFQNQLFEHNVEPQEPWHAWWTNSRTSRFDSLPFCFNYKLLSLFEWTLRVDAMCHFSEIRVKLIPLANQAPCAGQITFSAEAHIHFFDPPSLPCCSMFSKNCSSAQNLAIINLFKEDLFGEVKDFDTSGTRLARF